MIFKLKFIEGIVVTNAMALAGFCIGRYLNSELENGLFYALGLFFVSIVIMKKSCVRKNKNAKRSLNYD
jgi:hypothetical protein